MNNKDIRYLLDMFYDGTATKQQEQQLKDFFLNNQDINPEWEDEREYFRAICDASDIKLPEGLEERLDQRLSEHIKTSRKFTLRNMFYRVTTAAAVVLLCVSLFVIDSKNKQNNMLADTFTDPMEAALVAEEALIFISEQLNLGLGQVKEAREEIQKINQSVYDQLND